MEQNQQLQHQPQQELLSPLQPPPPEQRGPQLEQNDFHYQALEQHRRRIMQYLVRGHLMGIRNDNYDQHKQSLQNDGKNLCQREQQHRTTKEELDGLTSF
jgi:hypothetical protein